MKVGIIVVIAALVGVVAANYLLVDTGRVVISMRGYLVETTVVVLAFAVLAVMAAIWSVFKLFAGLRAAGRYRADRAAKKLSKGLIEVAEVNYARGEKLLARSMSNDAPLFGYLQAARAAHLQGEDERRDDWLRIAYEKKPDAANAVFLTQAEFQLDRGQHEQALATLRQIEQNTKDHSHALALLGRLYYQLEDWDELGKLLPRIEKQGRVEREMLDEWTVAVRLARLEQAVDVAELDSAWKAVPKRLKSNLDLLDAWLDGLVRVGEPDRAEKELAALLKSDWRGPLVRKYGLIESSDANRQLATAERWLDKHADDADLLLTAARLCTRNELWGKARSYLETVITLAPTPEAYQAYGQLLNEMGEGDAAAEAFKSGLGMVAGAPLPQIPHLDPDQG